jgi:hypothetical protein
MAWPKCPVCESIEEVQPASVAVAAGKAWPTWRGLALRLSDPSCPKWEDPGGALGSYRWGWLYGAILVALLIGGPLLPGQTLIGILVMLVVILIGLGIAGRRTWGTREVVRYNRAVAAWNRSVAPKWQDLHYCHRCDRVFTPGTSLAMSPEDWRRSLGESPDERWSEEELGRAIPAAKPARAASPRPGPSGED